MAIDDIKFAEALRGRVEHALRDMLGIGCKVRLLNEGTLPRSEGKAVRVEDTKKIRLEAWQLVCGMFIEGGEKMLVKQMSVFVENTTGRLADLTGVLAENNIDIIACTIADTVDFGILRCIVEEPEKATEILKKHGFTASITEVVSVSLEDKPGGLDKVLRKLAAEDISVNYIYSTIRSEEGKAIIIMKVEDPKKAMDILEEAQ